MDVNEDYEGEYIHVMGQFRSYNRHEEKKNRLVLSVFAREVEFVEDDDENMKSNAIFLDGYICKPPVYRKTPLGPFKIHFHNRIMTTEGTTMGKVKAVRTTYWARVDFTAYRSSAVINGTVITINT